MNKRLTTTALMALMLTTPAMLFAATGTVGGSYFVREQPSKDAKIVGAVKKGEVVEYSPIADNPQWVMVTGKRLKGAMARTALTAQVPLSPSVAKAVKGAQASIALQLAPPVAAQQTGKTVEINPAGPEAKSQVFEIVPEVTPEELRLQGENGKLADRIKGLETQIAQLLPLKDEIVKLRNELSAKEAEVAQIRNMFPYLAVIEMVEKKGEDVVITGIGKARMVTEADRVIIRLESDSIAKGDKVMNRVAKERYQTGGEKARAYYVLQNKSIKQG